MTPLLRLSAIILETSLAILVRHAPELSTSPEQRMIHLPWAQSKLSNSYKGPLESLRLHGCIEFLHTRDR